jgi:serine/threonine-protein kinase
MPNGLIKLVDFGLAKVLAPEEVTITIIQGQGTLSYTPLEQYGGEDMHTDARADIYALGATLYHLLTNEPPADARRRFLEPQSLKPPRAINPALSSRTEQAILWAMALHPDQRPANIEVFRQALLEGRAIFSPLTQPRTPFSWQTLALDREVRLWAAILLGLLMISLFLSL